MKVMAILKEKTYVVEHNPNCNRPYLVRLPGRSGVIDKKSYHDGATGDALGFGNTLREAASRALKAKELMKRNVVGVK